MPELAAHHPGDVRRLDQVLEHVLAVRGAVAQPPEQISQLRVHVGDPDVHERVLARPHAERLDLRLAALVGFLDPLRVDPAIQDQPLERQPADLAPDRVEARQQHRLGRVVDDQVDAGHRLEGADVAALPADDPALHLIARQVQHRDDRLAGLLAGDALDRQRHDLAGALVAFLLRLALDVPDDARGVALGLVLDRRDKLGLGLIGGQAGDPLQLRPCGRLPSRSSSASPRVQLGGALLGLAG